MSLRTPSAASLLPTLAALLMPVTAGAQVMVDLPGLDRPLSMVADEIFSVGSIEGEEWESFSRVRQVAFDGQGNLYILDAQNFRVVKVGPGGEFIATLGRAGGGPGEFGLPLTFSVTEAGEVRVFDLRQQGFTVFNPDGSFETTVRVAGGEFFSPNGALLTLPDGRMVDGGLSRRAFQVMGGEEEDQLGPRPIHLISLSGDPQITTAYDAWNPLTAVGTQREGMVNAGGIQAPGPPLRAFDAGLFVGVFPDGRIAVADSSAYTIKFVYPGRGLVQRLRRPFTPRRANRRDQADERDRQMEQIAARETSGGSMRVSTSDGRSGRIGSDRVAAFLTARVEGMEFGEEIPVLAGMAVDWAGRIWVHRAGPRIGEDGTIDLIDNDGGYVGSIAAGDFRIPDAFGPNGLAAYIETDALDVPRVVVKRLGLR